MYEELIKRLRERAQRENDYFEHGGDIIKEAADAIEELSKERKIGMWLDYDDTERFTARCSLCGDVIDTRFSMHYCPNCGAKMGVDDGRT